MSVAPCVLLLLPFGMSSACDTPSSLFFFLKKKLATIRRYERPAGLFITVYVYIVYLIALRFEGCVLAELIISHL